MDFVLSENLKIKSVNPKDDEKRRICDYVILFTKDKIFISFPRPSQAIYESNLSVGNWSVVFLLVKFLH